MLKNYLNLKQFEVRKIAEMYFVYFFIFVIRQKNLNLFPSSKMKKKLKLVHQSYIITSR